jgi:hypothetical protein
MLNEVCQEQQLVLLKRFDQQHPSKIVLRKAQAAQFSSAFQHLEHDLEGVGILLNLRITGGSETRVISGFTTAFDRVLMLKGATDSNLQRDGLSELRGGVRLA